MNLLTTWSERFGHIARAALPAGLMLVLLILNITSFNLPYVGTVRISLFLIAVYYWAVYRPTLVPPLFLFGAGLLIDVLNAYPLGLNAAIFLTVRWFITQQRRFLTSQTFIVIWLGFALISLFAGAIQWMVLSALSFTLMPLSALLYVSSLNILFFPILAAILHFMHRLLPLPGTPLQLRMKGF